MVDSLAGKSKHLFSVRVLKRRVVAYIKRLKTVRGIRRHIERNNLIRSIELIEFRYYIAAVAIKNKEVVDSLYIRLRILIKMLNPFIPQLIYSLAVVADGKYLVSR
jgi:hypothetical protein